MNDSSRRFKLDEILAALILAAMAIIAFANIVGRNCFGLSLSFTEELCLNLFVYLTILGTGLAFQRKANLGFAFLHDRISASKRRWLAGFSCFLSVTLFLIINILLIRTMYEEITVFQTVSSGMGIPAWWYYSPIPLLSCLVIYRIIRSFMNGEKPNA